MKEEKNIWRNADKERPRRGSSIIVITEENEIFNCIYDYEGKIISSGIVESSSGYEAVLMNLKWSDIRGWFYVNDVEQLKVY